MKRKPNIPPYQSPYESPYQNPYQSPYYQQRPNKDKQSNIKKFERIIIIAGIIFIVFIYVIVPIVYTVEYFNDKSLDTAKNTDSTTQVNCSYYDSLRTASIGDTFVFGTYEQDNDLTTKNEGIIWAIVEKEGSRIKLFSTKTIDCKRFYSDDGFNYTPWSQTSIRNWLNTSFYNNAFSIEEKQIIISTTVTTDDGEGVDISIDKVFLISDDEYCDYVHNGSLYPYVGTTRVTDYAISQDDIFDDITNGYASWYTRSQKSWSGFYGHVHYAPGDICRNGDDLSHVWSGAHTGGIKPCLWIDYSIVN